LLVEFANDDALHMRQGGGEHVGVTARCAAKGQQRPDIEAGDPEAGNARLAVGIPNDAPGLQPLQRVREVDPIRTIRTSGLAGAAIVYAPAEMPFGEGVDAFFSALSR